MEKKKNYYLERDIKNLKRIYALLVELPPFAEDYFRGIEQRTSVETRLKYAYDLRIFFHFLVKNRFRNKEIRDLTIEDLGQVNQMDLELFLSRLSLYDFNGKQLRCNERAKARKLSAVRSMFHYFFTHDMIGADNSVKVSMPKLHDKEIIRLDSGEVSEILSVADSGDGLSSHAERYHGHTHCRDTAILTLFLGTGIRISELVGLDNQSIDFSDNSFVVQRKGGNKAILYFSDEVAIALKRYMEEKAGDPKVPAGENALFLSMQYRRMSIRAIEILVKKYAKIVSPLKKITPHKLRSTYGTMLYRETGDIYVVADVLGHRDVNTTKKHYAAITEDRRRQVAGKVVLHPEDEE